MPIGEQANAQRRCGVHPVEYHLSRKKKAIVLMTEPEDIMLREISQAQKDKDRIFSHMQRNQGLENIQKNGDYLEGKERL